MSTFGALLMLFGSVAFTASVIAGLYAVFGVWAAGAIASLFMVGIGGAILRLWGEDL